MAGIAIDRDRSNVRRKENGVDSGLEVVARGGRESVMLQSDTYVATEEAREAPMVGCVGGWCGLVAWRQTAQGMSS